jgi:hypothetical protein
MHWDSFNNLWNTISDQWLWLIAAAVLVVLLWLVVAYMFYKPKPQKLIPEKQDGWSPTGRIDLLDPEATGNFFLQAEDTRTVVGLGSVEHREIRWRKATLEEAKTVVVAYHTQRNLATAANFVVRRKLELENENPKPQPGKDEPPDGKAQA